MSTRDEALFENYGDGLVPRRISIHDIRRWHLASFPELVNDENIPVMEEALEAVYTMFSGCETLFNRQPKQIWYDKTTLLFRLLTCWYIADQYPLMVDGVPVMGAIPLKAKKIAGVHLVFQDNFTKGQNPDYQDLLSSLKSNPWGGKAYMMIRSSAKRLNIGGRKRV